jgi:hypothetical protein
MRAASLLLIVFVCAFIDHAQSTVGKRLNRVPAQLQAAVPDSGTTLPIRRVILYSNGVAYIERRGIVTGNAEINLPFKQSQVDDVLKSMVVLDLGQGKIGSVSYDSSMPAAARTAEIPLDIPSESEESESDAAGIAGVLVQLQGAKVLVNSTRGTATGAILSVEKRKNTAKGKDAVEISGPPTYSLVIASEDGEISSFDLSDVRSVKLLDDSMRRDINEFANATASARIRDAKTIRVTSNGTGQRELVVSYIIAAPIWKTTYRVVLDDQGKPFFQGWAIVDNVSDENWQNVQLSLVSGSPVSFIQNLQRPLYRNRPIIPIPEDLNLKPQIYDPESGEGYGNGNGMGAGSGNGNGTGSGDISPSAVVNKPMFEGANNNYIVSSGYSGSSVSDAIVTEKGGVETAATGDEIGDLFEYKIEQPISVERNRSALIPIIQTKMEGERVSIFREPENTPSDAGNEDSETEAVRKANPRPMSGMLLKNVTAMTFEGGPMTILDRDAYAGEALMERLKPKEQRLISFALDLGTLARVEEKEDREPAKLVRVVDGVFQVHYFKTAKKIYHLTNQTERAKVIYVEHPVRKNWILSENYAKPDYTTARFYRFRVELGPFETKEVTVGENLGMMDKYDLSALSPKDLDVFVAGKYIDDAVRAQLAKLIDLRMQINQINAKLALAEKETEEITKDQARFRENIEALSKTSEAKQLIERYIAKANDQESRLEQLNKDSQSMTNEKDTLERELANEIKNLEIK